jgi:hypothetical protein
MTNNNMEEFTIMGNREGVGDKKQIESRER